VANAGSIEDAMAAFAPQAEAAVEAKADAAARTARRRQPKDEG
jgi:hypothetical protein